MRKKQPNRTTTIRILGEPWTVPHGFGAKYRSNAEHQLRMFRKGKPAAIIDFVIDVMGLIGYAPTREAVADWPLRKRVEAIIYAANVHARASDNPVQRHPELPWLRGVVPWHGRADLAGVRPDLRGAFAGLAPTEIGS